MVQQNCPDYFVTLLSRDHKFMAKFSREQNLLCFQGGMAHTLSPLSITVTLAYYGVCEFIHAEVGR